MILLWIFQLCAGYLLVPEGGERGRQWRSLAVEADDEHLRLNNPSATNRSHVMSQKQAGQNQNARQGRTHRKINAPSNAKPTLYSR